MQLFKTEAIVLRRTNYGEADKILNILTPERGQMSVIAKGVRRQKSKLAGGLELFAVGDVTIAFGHSDMGVVTSARMRQAYHGILQSYERTEAAYAMIKRIYVATRSVSDPDFYTVLQAGLHYLNLPHIDWRVVELWFSVRLQGLLGHAINMLTNTAGEPLKADERYHFDFTEHAFYPAPGGRFGGDHIKLLRLAGQKSPAVLGHISGIQNIVDDALWLVRSIDA